MGIAIPQVITPSKASGAHVIDGSLKFDQGKTQHLTRTPSTDGHKRTWTWSGWVKPAADALGDASGSALFAAYSDSNYRDVLRFGGSSTDAVDFQHRRNGTNYGGYTDAKLRDYGGSGWYHVVLAWNDGATIYVNGVEQSLSAAAGGLTDADNGQINNDRIHYIGARSSSGSAELGWDGQMSQIYFVDGQALEPTEFGFTDPLTNTWKPKKAKIPGFNDGTVWSSNSTNFTNPGQGFNGTYDNYAEVSTSSAKGTFTFPKSIQVENNVTFIFSSSTAGNLFVNDSTTAMQGTSFQIQTISFSGTLSSISLQSTSQPVLYYFSVDGSPLIDSVTNNFGLNGFYLPFDGNSPIGQDKSGNGNDWTPVNFGGSVALDNPQVSGARPVLNTTQGGTQAGVGVFGSKQNVGYAVTVYNDGGGNKYYIDGVKQDTVTGLIRGAKYTFDTSDSTVSSHPFRFSATSNGSHGGGSEYTSGVVAITGAATTITVPHDAPNTLYYYCTSHSGMGADITGITTNEKLADQYASSIQLSVDHAGSAVDNTMAFNGSANKMSSFSANNSTYASTVAGQGSPYNSALYINGTGDYPRINFTAGDFNFMHNQDDSGTVEFWFYNGAYSTEGYIFANVGESSQVGLVLVMGSATTFNCYIQRGVSGGSQNAGTSPLPQNKWSHIAVTKQKVGSNVHLKVYVNGVNTASNTSITATDLSNSNSQKTYWQTGSSIGHESSRGFTNAYISDIRIYNIVKYTGDFVVPSTSPDILPDTPSGVAGGSKLTKITDGAVSFDGTNDYLSVADSSDLELGDSDFTIEGYYYISSLSAVRSLYAKRANSSSYGTSWYVNTNGSINIALSTNGSSWTLDSASSTGVVGTNKWHHLAVTRSGTSVKQFVDGIEVDSGTLSGSIHDNSSAVTIGVSGEDASFDFSGFMSNVRVIKGTALYTSRFTPPTAPLTNVTNTKLLCCQSNTSATEAAVTPGSITANGDAAATNFNPFNTDINTVRGQETGYCTLNPLRGVGTTSILDKPNPTLSDGNLTASAPSNGNDTAGGTIGVSSGKWYFELTNVSGGNNTDGVGLADFTNGKEVIYRDNADFRYDGSTSSYGASWQTSGDVVGVKIDLDNSTIGFFVNGVYQGDAKTDLPSVTYHPLVYNRAGAPAASELRLNFGQKPFKFSPPDGFQPLTTANTRPVNVISRPDQYVGVTTYSGNSSSSNFVTDLNFNSKPDFVWIKARSGSSSPGTQNHYLVDSVRGASGSVTKKLYSNSTGEENAGQTDANNGINFVHNGFELTSSNDGTNANNAYVAWCWKAGGSKNTFNVDDVGYASAAAAGLTGGDITPTGASVGTKQGFSIVKFTGPGSAGFQSVPHGLSEKPKFILCKDLDNARNWGVFHEDVVTTDVRAFILNSNSASFNSGTSCWDVSAINATTFTPYFRDDFGASYSADNIAYLWHDVPGLQKFGSYTGNGNADGPFNELGFRPALIWLKRANGEGDWRIWDTTRDPINFCDNKLYANKSDVETGSSDTNEIDIYSNGFKLRSSVSEGNTSGELYMYCAWAEAPSIDLYGGGANAR